jgi:hypothetical protein
MISTFAHELLSSEFVMLLFFAIRIDIENDSKDVFDFKSATIFFFRNDHFSFMKKRFRFYEFCDSEFENFASRLRFFCEIQSHFDATRQIDFLLFFYSYFAVRSSRDVFTIFTCVAFLMLVDDVEIAIARAMFFRACVAYDSNFAMFIDMIVFLTIKTLS